MNQEQLEALLNYTAQQQGITPELARQNWESNFGPAISVDPLDMGSGQGALGELSAGDQQPVSGTYYDYVTNEMAPVTDQLREGGITEDEFRQSYQDVITDASSLDFDPVAEEAEKNMAYLRSETGGQKLSDAFGLSGSNLEKLYMADPETGRQFVWDRDDNGWQGLSPEYYGLDPTDLQMTSAMTKQKGDWVKHDYEGEDPLYFGGAIDPTTMEKWAADSARDDKSDNDIWYTDPQGVQRVDVSGTGQGIPVGSTNITRDPTQLSYMQNVADPQLGLPEGTWIKRDIDPSAYFSDSDLTGPFTENPNEQFQFTSPVLEKTYKGYQAVGTSTPDELSKIPESGTLLEAFTPQSLEGKPYDLGKIFGLDEGKLVFSNPPSDRFNLEPFFNQTDSLGMDNFIKSQQRDTLQMINDGNFFTALAGGKKVGPKEDDFVSLDEIYPAVTGTGGLNLVLDKLQGQGQFDDPKSGIDSGYQVDPFDTEQVASITGDEDTTTPEDTTPYKVNAYKGGVGPYARNYIFQRYGYDTDKIDWELTYDPVQELYFFPNGEAVDPKLLEGVKFTKLDEDGEPIETADQPSATNGADATTDWPADMQTYYLSQLDKGLSGQEAMDKTKEAYPDYGK